MTSSARMEAIKIGAMKKLILMAALTGALFAGAPPDFPLNVHVVQVDMAQGENGVIGNGSTDVNGNYNSHVSGGGTYLYHVFTVRIDGDPREFKMVTPAAHVKGGPGLAMATLGWSAVATRRSNSWLHIGDYKGSWNKNGSLEIEFLDANGKVKHQPFFIKAEILPQTK